MLRMILILAAILPLHLPEVSTQLEYRSGVSGHQYFLQPIFNPGENYIISQCEQDALNLIASVDQYTDKNGRYSFPCFQGIQDKIEDRKVYEKEKQQLPFECIARYGLNRTYNIGVEELSRFHDLVLKCKDSQPQITCDPLNPYRTFDGKCNNQMVPLMGSVQTCARRLMPASYEGVSDFRKSKCGIPLPSPRSISRILLKDIPFPNLLHSNILTYFAQFLSHDISQLPTSHGGDLNIDCCSNLLQQHPQCAPILLSPDDPYVLRLNITCFNFVRAAPCPSCALGKRNQMIQPTSYIDASSVYGSSNQESKNLRTNDGTGKLLEQDRSGEKLPPPDLELGFCGNADNSEYCFKAGDGRANMDTPTMTFHTIFFREHNRLATALRELNPNWTGDTLFQEARKILIAELQMITYNEFLPLLLGVELMTAYDLWIGEPNGTRTQYDPYTDPTILTEFSAGAFRLHNIISGIVTNLGVDGDKRTLTDFTRDASTLYNGQMTMLLEGMCLHPTKMFSRHVATQITQPLYRKNRETAFDLSAIDIQRGRDAGVPSYTEVLNYLSVGAINIQTFEDLLQVFDPADIDLLKTVYCDPRDIDFLVGMYIERVPDNMMLSKSSARIIAQQFTDLKFGDRFYFEHLGNFDDNQLSSLKDVTIARMFCDNGRLAYVQQLAMMLPSSSNPIKLCSDIPKLNLNFWKEENLLKM